MKPLYINYARGAGGKALINCLHCSHDVMFNDISIIQQQQAYHNGSISLEQLDDIILQRILKTIPDADSIEWWSNFEINNLIKGCDNPIPCAQSISFHIPDDDKWLPLVCHNYDNWICYTQSLGYGITIKLESHVPFLDTAIRIKWLKTEQAPNPSLDMDSLNQWRHDAEKIKTDMTVCDYDPLDKNFVAKIDQIARKCNINIRWNIALQYLNKYQQYHWHKIKQLNLSYASADLNSANRLL